MEDALTDRRLAARKRLACALKSIDTSVGDFNETVVYFMCPETFRFDREKRARKPRNNLRCDIYGRDTRH
jgi:hypothetical protein